MFKILKIQAKNVFCSLYDTVKLNCQTIATLGQQGEMFSLKLKEGGAALTDRHCPSLLSSL